ncbi:SAM-dependent methyltransferase [Clostridia bacterium]|nr:SAM-dependent methyltransferase [Clostridia bacterium]
MNKTVKISKRLSAIAEIVRFKSVCDIGCDHGILPLFLLQSGSVEKVAVCDISEPSLNKAREALSGYSQALVRLSDGLAEIEPNEFETCVIAGMGGLLIKDILSRRLNAAKAFSQIILSPHNNVFALRKFLVENSFEIAAERIVFEDGKWYNILECRFNAEFQDIYSRAELLFGKFRPPMFYDFIKHELERARKIELAANGKNGDVTERIKTCEELLDKECEGVRA